MLLKMQDLKAASLNVFQNQLILKINPESMSSTKSSSSGWQQSAGSFLALFTSTGTLICCALPALVVAIAGGSAMVSLLSTFPWLATLSAYSGWIFIIAGIMILFSGILIIHPRSEEHTSELQSRGHLVCRLLLEKNNT